MSDTDYTGLHFLDKRAFLDKNASLLLSHWFRLKWIKRDAKCFPHEKINRCLTDINQCLTNINRYLTNTGNQFYKILVILVKFRLSISLHRLYLLNISLLRFLP